MSMDQTNKGVLFKNADKKSDNHPDYSGFIYITPELAGKEVQLSAWIKESGPQSKNPGTKYMSLAVREKEQKKDDIPF